MNMPIFRAKKIDSDEYVEGGYSDTLFLCMGDIQGHYISYKKINVVGREITLQESINPTTISIHFPNMLDSQGNKIFASLSEDGKGGDIFILGDERLKYISMIHNNQLMAKQQNTYGSFIGQGYAPTNKWKVIGIKE